MYMGTGLENSRMVPALFVCLFGFYALATSKVISKRSKPPCPFHPDLCELELYAMATSKVISGWSPALCKLYTLHPDCMSISPSVPSLQPYGVFDVILCSSLPPPPSHKSFPPPLTHQSAHTASLALLLLLLLYATWKSIRI